MSLVENSFLHFSIQSLTFNPRTYISNDRDWLTINPFRTFHSGVDKGYLCFVEYSTTPKPTSDLSTEKTKEDVIISAHPSGSSINSPHLSLSLLSEAAVPTAVGVARSTHSVAFSLHRSQASKGIFIASALLEISLFCTSLVY